MLKKRIPPDKTIDLEDNKKSKKELKEKYEKLPKTQKMNSLKEQENKSNLNVISISSSTEKEKDKSNKSLHEKDSNLIKVPHHELLGKKFSEINKMFPVLLPGYHDAILNLGHKGKHLN